MKLFLDSRKIIQFQQEIAFRFYEYLTISIRNSCWILEVKKFQYEIVVRFQKKYFNQKQPHEFTFSIIIQITARLHCGGYFRCYTLTLCWLFSGCELTCARYLRVQHTLNVPCGGYFRSNNFTLKQFLDSERCNNFNMKQFTGSQKDQTKINNFNIK